MTAEAFRHRITFATERTLAYVSVLDLGRIWERTLRRAGVPLQYSQGFHPRPKMQIALPLPTGCGGEAEWLDIWLEVPWSPERVREALVGKTPRDLTLRAVAAVDEDAPALEQEIDATEYEVLLRDVDRAALESAVAEMLAAETLLRPKRGRRHNKSYDLRPLVTELAVVDPDAASWEVALQMRLTARPGATGRPDEVLKALDLEEAPRRCTRLRLILPEDEET
ncbi:MAG: TIGR03936 family radical SAM-associated protein [Anaerolineales bacterium]